MAPFIVHGLKHTYICSFKQPRLVGCNRLSNSKLNCQLCSAPHPLVFVASITGVPYIISSEENIPKLYHLFIQYILFICIIIYLFQASGGGHPSLISNLMMTSKPYWIDQEPQYLKENGILNCFFRFQHIYDLDPCTIIKTSSGKLYVRLQKPEVALTPGQVRSFKSLSSNTVLLLYNDECQSKLT